VAGSAYSDLSFTVDPEELYNAASSLQQEIDYIKRQFAAMDQAVNKSAGFWIGDAGDKYRKVYKEQVKEADRMFRRLMEHVTDLREIAGVYVNKENESVGLAQQLPSDVIF